MYLKLQTAGEAQGDRARNSITANSTDAVIASQASLSPLRPKTVSTQNSPVKSAFYITSAIVVLVANIGCTTQGSKEGSSVAGTVVTVQYVDPQHFTDFSIHDRDIRYSASFFTQKITTTLQRVMNNPFPGERLTLRFTNIDLAGHGATGTRSVRVVRMHTPARLSFDYSLQDQTGSAIANGTQTLVETLPLGHGAHAGSTSLLSIESKMLDKWLRGLSVAR
jgi:Protein of unknown function (DUF3016)